MALQINFWFGYPITQLHMQTAFVEAVSPDESYHEPVRILFATGSHRTHVTEELQPLPKLLERIADFSHFSTPSFPPPPYNVVLL